MPSDCCYFVGKAAAAGAAPALNYFGSILHCSAVFTQNLGQTFLRSGFHNMQFVDFYRSYADEDSEESREDVTSDYTFEPGRELMRAEQTEAVFGALNELSYREREVIRSHIGFCPDCHSMKSPKFRPHTFQEIAYKNELSSAEAAENIYHEGLAKMKEKLQKKGIFHP